MPFTWKPICPLQDVETCDLLVVDRSIDPVAPVVHDWSYEALIHDLLPVEARRTPATAFGLPLLPRALSVASPPPKSARTSLRAGCRGVSRARCLYLCVPLISQGNVYKYRYVNNQDKEDERDVILDDGDKLFRELKTLHIGDVFNKITELKDEFLQKDKTAKARLKKGEKDIGDAKNIMRGIEMFQRKLREINVHDTIATDINKITRARGLTELGELEQDLIYGEKANSKTIKKFLEAKGGKARPPVLLRAACRSERAGSACFCAAAAGVSGDVKKAPVMR